MTEDVEAFGIGRHEAVFDAVMNHLHEMSGAMPPAMQVAVFGGRGTGLTARNAGRGIDRRRERGEDRGKSAHDVLIATDHLAEAALQSPDAAARADVDIVNALW